MIARATARASVASVGAKNVAACRSRTCHGVTIAPVVAVNDLGVEHRQRRSYLNFRRFGFRRFR